MTAYSIDQENRTTALNTKNAVIARRWAALNYSSLIKHTAAISPLPVDEHAEEGRALPTSINHAG